MHNYTTILFYTDDCWSKEWEIWQQFQDTIHLPSAYCFPAWIQEGRIQVQCLEHQIYLALIILTMLRSGMEVTQSWWRLITKRRHRMIRHLRLCLLLHRLPKILRRHLQISRALQMIWRKHLRHWEQTEINLCLQRNRRQIKMEKYLMSMIQTRFTRRSVILWTATTRC